MESRFLGAVSAILRIRIMSFGSGSVRRAVGVLKPAILTSEHVCFSCRKTLSRRQYASAATAQAPIQTPPITPAISDATVISTQAQPQYAIKAGILLSRPPLITPDPHPFETAFYLYQRRLNERLVLPFTQYFYYKRGTPAFEYWRTKRRERGGVAARDVGGYSAHSNESWNDEVLVGNNDGSPEKIVKLLVEEEGRASEFVAEGEDQSMAGLKRRTEADKVNDQRSLERSLSRTLYLLVREKAEDRGEANWQFPSARLEGKEGLKEGAQRILTESCGVNMNTWFVGSHPVGHYICQNQIGQSSPSSPAIESDAGAEVGDKTFFMKARIMAGQADPKNGSKGVEDFRWLAKEEIAQLVPREYWHRVKNMLSEQ